MSFYAPKITIKYCYLSILNFDSSCEENWNLNLASSSVNFLILGVMECDLKVSSVQVRKIKTNQLPLLFSWKDKLTWKTNTYLPTSTSLGKPSEWIALSGSNLSSCTKQIPWSTRAIVKPTKHERRGKTTKKKEWRPTWLIFTEPSVELELIRRRSFTVEGGALDPRTVLTLTWLHCKNMLNDTTQNWLKEHHRPMY